MYARTFNRLRFRGVKPFFIHQLLHIETPFKLIHYKVVPIPCQYELVSKSLIRLYSSDGDLIVEPEPLEEHLYEESLPEFSFTKILYTEDDPKIKVLNQCKSPDELLDMFEREGSHFQTNQLVQTVVLLWNFCRKELHSQHLREFIQTHIAFESLLLRLLKSAQFLNCNENTCCYLYLKRIGINSSHKLMQQLLLDNLYTISKDEDIPLSVLSRFSVAVSFDSDLNTILVCHDMMPHLLKSLEKCNSAEELRLSTLCLSNIRQMVSSETLEMYKTKVNELMRSGKLCTENTKCILKVLNFLNHPVWSHRNFSESRRLMLLLSPVVDNLSENEVTALLKIFQNQLEPAAIVPKLLRVSEKLMEKYPTHEMLASVVQFVEPKKREHFINLFQKLLKDELMWEQPNAALYFFTVLRALKISDSELCDDYWTRVLNNLDSKAEEREYYVFSRHCRRYMYFNNNLGGTYRHIEFEKRLTQLCMDEINTGISGVIPSKFANIASFVIGYGHTYRGNSKLPVVILNKIESMENQFSVSDCLQLSRGIQIALQMRFRHFIPKTMVTQLTAVENELNKCTKRHLKNLKSVDANDINAVVRALINRKASRKSTTYQAALNKYNSVQSNTLNSRMLRNMSFNLSSSHFVAPQILEKMFAYIMKHEHYVTGDTAEKILSCSYNLGYSPQLQAGLSSAANILIRDFDYMTGLSIIQACLALCFFKTLPEQLINKVFSVDFIKRIEEEIGMCYSRATYPERVLNHVMQLNRAVCLDFPEADIPWFQQNYVEAQLSKYPFVQNKYNEEIRQSLLYVLKNESFFRCNHITPYGYRIDFVIHFDKGKKPIPTPVETTILDKITKVAILLLRLDSFCENDLNTLRGKEALKIRHLEMLGYKVIYINETNWKHMAAQNDKTNYIKCLLQISA